MERRGFAGYVQKADREPRLSRDRERLLFKRYREHGDSEALDRLLTSHLRLVVFEAYRQKHYGVPVDELVAEGNLGLIHAAFKFDEERDVRFSTYASYWIRAYIVRRVIKGWSIVSTGAGDLTSRNFFRLRRDRNRLATRLGEGPELLARLAQDYGRPEEEIARMLRRIDRHDDSLDQPLLRDGNRTGADVLAEPRPDPEQTALKQDGRRKLKQAVAPIFEGLDDREVAVLRERLMCDTSDRTTLQELGHRFDISRERVRQIENALRSKLKRRLIGLWRKTGGELFDIN